MVARKSLRLPELWILTALSILLHAWRLFTPGGVIFDEVYYEKFAGYSLDGTHFFDVHPPFGRLLFAATAAVFRVPAEHLTAGGSAPHLRILPAAFGAMLAPLVFILLRKLGATRKVATLGGIAILLENALLVIARTALPDILLIVLGVAAIVGWLTSREHQAGARLMWVAISALLAGAALSVKWTGASALGIIMVMWLADAYRDRANLTRHVAELAVLVALPVAVYLAAFQVQFSLVRHAGPGDLYMSGQYQRTLPENVQYNPAAPKLSYWAKLREVHHAIRYGNGSLQNVSNPGASPWYTWPIMKHPIPFAESSRPNGQPRSLVILLGNPVVWWWALLVSGAGLVLLVVRRARFAGLQESAMLLTFAVLLNYVPFMAIKRVMYLYHYLFALVFLIALASLVSGALAGWLGDDAPPWRFASGRSAAMYAGLVGLMLVGFLYFAPFTFYLPLSPEAFDARFTVLHPF